LIEIINEVKVKNHPKVLKGFSKKYSMYLLHQLQKFYP